jgi:hypothetical protein
MRIALLLAVIMANVLSCQPYCPTRPPSVPSEAVWAGGPDGGAWIVCKWRTKEPLLEYDCQVFSETGSLWSNGTYLMATEHGIPLTGLGKGGSISSFQFYDGRIISISSRRSLIPEGWVTYPTGSEHGEIIRYEKGIKKENSRY